MELVLISKKAGLDSGAKRSLQEKFEQGRGVDDDHAESRSSRMTDRGRRLRGHALSTVESGQHLVARRSCGQTFKFGEEVIGERLSRARGADLQPAVQGVRHIPDLDHLGTCDQHACMLIACQAHGPEAFDDGWGIPRQVQRSVRITF